MPIPALGAVQLHLQQRVHPQQLGQAGNDGVAQFDALVNVHFKGVFFLPQKLLPLMLAPANRWVNAQRIEASGGQFL